MTETATDRLDPAAFGTTSLGTASLNTTSLNTASLTTDEFDPDASDHLPGVDVDAIATQMCRDVGARLRALREQRQMSLHDVEAFSDGTFVPSTIGAYERGERAISLPRLHRLAGLYGVPVEQLVPASDGRSMAYRSSPITEPLRIDIPMLTQLNGHAFSSLLRFIDNVRTHRGDVKSSVITLRSSDAIVVGAMLDVPVHQVLGRLAALDLTPPDQR